MVPWDLEGWECREKEKETRRRSTGKWWPFWPDWVTSQKWSVSAGSGGSAGRTARRSAAPSAAPEARGPSAFWAAARAGSPVCCWAPRRGTGLGAPAGERTPLFRRPARLDPLSCSSSWSCRLWTALRESVASLPLWLSVAVSAALTPSEPAVQTRNAGDTAIAAKAFLCVLSVAKVRTLLERSGPLSSSGRFYSQNFYSSVPMKKKWIQQSKLLTLL